MEKKKSVVLRVASLFYKDFHWKLLSFLLAFVLWFLGNSVNNPMLVMPYDRLNLTVLHRDQLALNNIVLLNEHELNNTFINASIRATRSNHELIQLARSDNIRASVDISTINFDHIIQAGEPITVPLDVDLFIHQDYLTRTMSPSTVNLVLDKQAVATIPIEVDVLGSPMEGFEQQAPILSNRMVRITGARSLLDQVNDVRVRIYVEDAYETVEDVEPLVVYNNRREIITDSVNLSIREVHITVPVFPYTEIPLEINTPGTVMPGFMMTNVDIIPPTVSLVGSAESLENISYIVLGDVDLTMASETTEYSFNIRQALVGTGLSLRAGGPEEATAVITVERVISRDFHMPLEDIAVSGNNQPFEFETEGPIMLSLRGRASVISALTLSQIAASVDLTGLGAGTHVVQVNVTPPPRAALANLVTVSITIEPEPIVFEPEEPADWTAELDNEEEAEGATDEDEEEEEEEVQE